MRNYTKIKKYVIRPSKRKEVLVFITEHFRGSKYQTAVSRVVENKAMSWRRWMYYFDDDFLYDILMEEDCIEVSEDELGI